MRLWKFFKESRTYYFIISVIFIVSALVGFFFPVFFTDFIKNFIEEILGKTEGLGFLGLFLFILWNNVLSSFLGLVFGIALGIAPLFYSFLNGYVLGFVLNASSEVYGLGVILRILPHGIFELPALVVSLGLGLRLGTYLFRKKKKSGFVEELINSGKVFLFIVIPLLIIAGVIEAGLIALLG